MFIPRIFISAQCLAVFIDHIRAHSLQQSINGRTAGTAVEPENLCGKNLTMDYFFKTGEYSIILEKSQKKVYYLIDVLIKELKHL
jgi:hypothetical protein